MVFFWPYFILFLLDILEEPSFRDRPIWENDSLIGMCDMVEEPTNSLVWFFGELVALVTYGLMGYEQLSPCLQVAKTSAKILGRMKL